jgi:hypothetical protein
VIILTFVKSEEYIPKEGGAVFVGCVITPYRSFTTASQKANVISEEWKP